jgi:hypothetical protein
MSMSVPVVAVTVPFFLVGHFDSLSEQVMTTRIPQTADAENSPNINRQHCSNQ